MNIISESLILVGAIILLFSIFKTRKILTQVKQGKFEQKWKILVSLMITFFLGYLASAYFVFSGTEKALFLISGSVFLLGAVFVYLVVRTSYLTISDLGSALESSKKEVDRRIGLEKEMETAADNYKQQNIVLLDLAKTINEKADDFAKIINQITEVGSEILNIERVSVWFYDDQKTSISCLDLYEKSKKNHSKGAVINIKDYPIYFEAIEKNRVVGADNALTDSLTNEYAKSYLAPLGINSMIDVAIWVAGKARAIICFEHVGPVRTLSSQEKAFAGTLADMVSLAIETSEKLKTEEKLRKSEERFRRLSEASFEGVIVHNKGKIVETNSAFAQLYGYTENEIIGHDVLELVAPESKELCKNNLEKSNETPYEVISLRKDNTVIYTEIIQKPFPSNGDHLSIIAVRDITWKKKAEQENADLIVELKKAQENLEVKIQERTKDLKAVNVALLREMEERKKVDEQIQVYQDVVNNVPIGLAIFQFENPEDTKSIKVVLGNPTVEKFANLKVKGSVGKYFHDISPETYQSGRDKVYQEVVKTGRAKDLGTIHYTGNETIPENYFHTLAFPLPNNSFGLSVENVTDKIKTEERFQRIYEASPAALLMLDTKGNIFEVNSQTEALYGYTKEELKKMNYVQLLPERFHKDFIETCNQFFANPEDSEKFKLKEKVILKKDGSEATVEQSFSSIHIKSEVYLLAAVVDITSRKKADEQVQIYQDVVKNTPVGIVIFQFENMDDIRSLKVISANPAAEKYYQAKAEDFVGKYLADFSPDSVESGRLEIYHEVAKTGQMKDLGVIHYKGSVKTDGAQIPENYFHLVVIPLPNNSIAFSAENVTEQVKTEERFQKVVEASPSALLMVDKEGKINLANSQAEILFGYTRKELQNSNIKKLVPEHFENEFTNYLENIFKSPEGSPGFRSKAGFVFRKNSSEVPVDISFSAIYTKTGVYILVSIFDITERKKSEEKIEIYDDIVLNIPIGILTFQFENIEDTKTLKAITANPAAEKIGSAKAADFLGKPWVKVSPDTFESGRDKIYQDVVKNRKIKDLGVVHYKGTPKVDQIPAIPENYFHFVAFPLPNNSFALSMENVTENVKSEERFEKIIQTSPNALLVVDKEGKIIMASSRAEILYGYSLKEFKNMNIKNLIPEHAVKEFSGYLENVFKSIEDPSGFPSKEVFGLRKDGSMVPVDISFTTIYTKTGTYILNSITDISERKKADEKIDVFENIVNNIPIGLDIMKFENLEDTKTLKVVATNKAYNKYSGIKGSDIIGKYAIDFSPEIFKLGQDKVFQNIVKNGEPQDLGTVHYEGNGKPENYIHINAFPINGNHIAVSYENITEQIKIEERFRLVVEAAPIAMIMVDKSGKISVVNTQAENLFGYTKEEFQNLDFGLLFSEQYRKEYFENRQQFFENPEVREKTQKLKQIILKKDKSELPVEISFIPIYSGKAIFMLASIPDNVVNKKMEEKKVEEKTSTVNLLEKL